MSGTSVAERVRTYRRAGVDVAAADGLLARLGPLIRSTHGAGVLRDRGQFAGLFRMPRLRDPVLVSSTDGVGTKLAVARRFGGHRAIGIDAVAMNVNDVLVYGARPLFFLDYIAMGRLNRAVFTQLVQGVVEGCKQSGCALLGGETAEMPGVYEPGEYDIAGFCVGAVERRRIIDGRRVRAGDVVVGLASSGVHANGFSLVRRALREDGLRRLKQALLAPTRIYVRPILAALARAPIAAMAHITGGGLARRLPSLVKARTGLRVAWRPGAWPVPGIFRQIQRAGGISDDEMFKTFNMGIGMAAACRPSDEASLIRLMAKHGIQAWMIGSIVKGRAGDV
ncbi:MAG: phosphoribosylformylglycinamidine cyclo-ligase [Candidatus Omnitrophica bacterium]|nr:phosphoribosylformylglycinamidine cyclo-ligase [Candidatus Omnitrophota bacterium]